MHVRVRAASRDSRFTGAVGLRWSETSSPSSGVPCPFVRPRRSAGARCPAWRCPSRSPGAATASCLRPRRHRLRDGLHDVLGSTPATPTAATAVMHSNVAPRRDRRPRRPPAPRHRRERHADDRGRARPSRGAGRRAGCPSDGTHLDRRHAARARHVVHRDQRRAGRRRPGVTNAHHVPAPRAHPRPADLPVARAARRPDRRASACR